MHAPALRRRKLDQKGVGDGRNHRLRARDEQTLVAQSAHSAGEADALSGSAGAYLSARRTVQFGRCGQDIIGEVEAESEHPGQTRDRGIE